MTDSRENPGGALELLGQNQCLRAQLELLELQNTELLETQLRFELLELQNTELLETQLRLESEQDRLRGRLGQDVRAALCVAQWSLEGVLSGWSGLHLPLDDFPALEGQPEHTSPEDLSRLEGRRRDVLLGAVTWTWNARRSDPMYALWWQMTTGQSPAQSARHG